jgi:4-hydroxybenzoate polyprenyltransferase
MTPTYHLGERTVHVGCALASLGLLAILNLWLGLVASIALVVAVALLLVRRRPGVALAFGAFAGLSVIVMLGWLAVEQAHVVTQPVTVDLGSHRVPVELSDGTRVLLDPVGVEK